MRLSLDPANAALDAAAGTITFSTAIPASLSHILRVVNMTRGVVYFNPTAEDGIGYVSTATYASPVLTLVGIDTRTHQNTDLLFIEYDDGSSGGGGGGGTGDASAANQVLQTNQLTAINTDLGAPADAAATTDAGTFGVIPLIKRGLVNWTALLARIPALQNGAVPISGIAADGFGNGTREYNFAQGTRTVVTTTSSAAIAIGTLGASRELMLIASTRCFVRFGTSAVTAALATDVNVLALPADAMFHLRVPAGVTHFTVIRDTAEGFIRTIPVA
jgi:hypothetical protein